MKESIYLIIKNHCLIDSQVKASSEQPTFYISGCKAVKCPKVEEIIIPKGIVSIERYALSALPAKTIKIPDSVTSIKAYAMTNCPQLETVVWSRCCDYIPPFCFHDCKSLVSVLNVEAVKAVGNSAFLDCESMENINLMNATKIDANVFKCCDSLSRIDFPSVTSVGAYCFLNCKLLKTVKFGSVKKLGASVFEGCSALQELSGLENAEAIGAKSFMRCESLESFVWPENCLTIPCNCFHGCTSLSSITIGSKVSVVRNQAFQNTGLEVLDLSQTLVAYVPSNLVRGSKHLKKVYMPYYASVISPQALRGVDAEAL